MHPSNLTDVNGTLFFSADDGIHGIEPWALGPLPPSASTPGAGLAALTPDASLSSHPLIAPLGSLPGGVYVPAVGSPPQQRILVGKSADFATTGGNQQEAATPLRTRASRSEKGHEMENGDFSF